MIDDDAALEKAVAKLKEPVRIDPDLDRRVMEAIERLPATATHDDAARSVVSWLRRRRTIRLSPLAGLAAAAALAAVMFAGVRFLGPGRSAVAGTAANDTAVPVAGGAGARGAVTQFVLVAPEAASVAVVGDFNDWSFSATPLERQPGDDVWWVTVPLRPGRYRYAFVVNGTSWQPDPNAPAAEDEFGRPNSVVTIGGA